MKVKITEIEATAEDLRACNSIVDGMTTMFRKIFNPFYNTSVDTEEDEDSDEE